MEVVLAESSNVAFVRWEPMPGCHVLPRLIAGDAMVATMLYHVIPSGNLT